MLPSTTVTSSRRTSPPNHSFSRHITHLVPPSQQFNHSTDNLLLPTTVYQLPITIHHPPFKMQHNSQPLRPSTTPPLHHLITSSNSCSRYFGKAQLELTDCAAQPH